MKFKMFFIIYLLSSSLVKGQTPYTAGEITDVRDGKTYQTIKIDNTVWLAENMKYKTENSDSLVKNDLGLIMDGYYYPYEETDKVCPNNFVIPKESDWEDYIQFLIELKNIPKTSIERFSSSNRKATGSGMMVSDNKLQLFDDSNPLNLEISGVIQGDKLISDGALTFWSRKDNLNDSKYHFHIFSNDYSNHTHKHHIIAKKKKKRKFVVRCVKTE